LRPAWTHLRLGRLALAQGQPEAAAAYFQRTLVDQSNNHYLWFWASCLVAYQDLVERRPEAARTRLEPILDRASSPADERVWVRHLLGWASVDLGDLERAEALLAAANTLLPTAHLSRFEMVEVLHSQARLELRQGRGPEAEQVLAEALALSQAMHIPYNEDQTLYLYGLLYLQQGETQPARERLEAALAILHRLGERLYAEQVEQALAGLER
jgi:tetratricopeptide (TPR) repeat protein